MAVTSQPAHHVWAEHVEACPAVGGAVRHMPELPPLPQLLPEIRVCRHRLVRRQIAVTRPGSSGTRWCASCAAATSTRRNLRRHEESLRVSRRRRGRCARDRAGERRDVAFSYPARFAHLDFVEVAVLVADYPLSMDGPTVRTATFPANGVVFELLREQKLTPPIAAPPVRFPLSLSRLGPSHHRTNGQTWELRFRGTAPSTG